MEFNEQASIIRLHFGRRKGIENRNNYMPTYKPSTYNNQQTSKNPQHIIINHNAYQEFGSIIKYSFVSSYCSWLNTRFLVDSDTYCHYIRNLQDNKVG